MSFTDAANVATVAVAQATSVASGVSAQLVGTNATRKGLEIVNPNPSLWLYLLPGGGTAIVGQGVALAPAGGSWDGLLSHALWTGPVQGVFGAAASQPCIAEAT